MLNRTKIGSAFLAAVLVLSLTACGGAETGSTAASTKSSSTETTASGGSSATKSSGSSGTSTGSGTASTGNSGMAEQTAVHAEDAEDLKTEIIGELTVTTDTADGVSAEGDVFTITKAGTYTFSGKSEAGRIVVDAEDEKVEIVLAGVSLTNSENSPIYIKDADKVTITAADGSYNEITDARSLRSTEDEESEEKGGAAIYAGCDLDIEGEGALVVTASYNNGIHTKNDLTIKKLTLKVTAPHNAAKGNDSISIKSGNLILISTGGDALKTTDSDISDKGNQRGTVTLAGGTIDLYAACDGIDAAYDVVIDHEDVVVNIYTDSYSSYTGEVFAGGTTTTDFYLVISQSLYDSGAKYFAHFYNDDESAGVWAEATYAVNVMSGGGRSGRTSYYGLLLAAPSGYANVAYYVVDADLKEESYLTDYTAKTDGGAVNSSMNAYLVSSISGKTISGDYTSLRSSSGDSSSEVSTKGIKADNAITILGGTILVYAVDDGLHVNVDVELENGEEPAGSCTISGGYVQVKSGDDGIHADNLVDICGGTVNVLTAYEGIEGNIIRFEGGSTYVYATDDGLNANNGSESPLIAISGGYLEVATASGDTDAIDSNGGFEVTGGFTLVRGGASSGSVAGSVDIGERYEMSVTGGTVIALGGICDTPGSGCVGTVIMNRKSFAAGSYQITDASGNVLAEFNLNSSYTGAWMSSESFATGGTYTLTKDGSKVSSWTQKSQSVSAS